MRVPVLFLVPLLVLPPALAAALPATAVLAAQEPEDLSAELETIRAAAGIPGLVALAVMDGEPVACGAAGVRVLGGDEPITADDPVHLGSCSKAMTATLAARLVEAEDIGWDTTVAEALPDLAAGADEGFHAVTLLDLLRHRGGIAERRRPEIAALHEELGAMEGPPHEVRLRILALVLASPPLPPPEVGFDYSNFGYMLAGAMLEARAGAPWEELLGTELFEPLGLERAGVGSPAGDGVPVGHVLAEDGTRTALAPGPGGVLPAAMGPAGLVHASLADWAGFVSEHVAGERGVDGVVSAASYRMLHQDVRGNGYAAGWGLARHTWSWGEGTVLTHNGSDTSWYSVVFALPEWDLVVVAAANCGSQAASGAVDEARRACLRALGFLDP